MSAHYSGKPRRRMTAKQKSLLKEPGKKFGKNPTKRATRKRVSRSLTKYVRNFTGTITRTQDGQVVIAGTGPKPKTAKNPKRCNPSEAFNVYLGTKKIDTVFQSSPATAADVKRSLVNHDGYDPRIRVTKQRKRK